MPIINNFIFFGVHIIEAKIIVITSANNGIPIS